MNDLLIKLFLKYQDHPSIFSRNDITSEHDLGSMGETLLNLAVVVGLVPITGVTLPFLSYGGSSLILSLVSIGIILNVSRHKEKS